MTESFREKVFKCRNFSKRQNYTYLLHGFNCRDLHRLYILTQVNAYLGLKYTVSKDSLQNFFRLRKILVSLIKEGI